MEREKIRQYIINHATVNQPRCFNGDWNVMLTLGSDINEHAPTIEKAYQKMTNRILSSSHFKKYITE